MKKVYPLFILLIVIGVYSNFAYNKVSSDDRQGLKDTVKNLQDQVKDCQDRIAYANKSATDNDNKMHDTLCVALPDDKRVIDGVFGRIPPTPTTGPTKVEK